LLTAPTSWAEVGPLLDEVLDLLVAGTDRDALTPHVVRLEADGTADQRHGGIVQPRSGGDLAESAAGEQFEAGRAAAGQEQLGQFAFGPAALQVGAGAGDEQPHRVGLAAGEGQPERPGGPMSLARLVVVVERDVQIGLAAEMVIEAADAGPRLPDDVHHVRVRVAGGREDLPGRGQQRGSGAAHLPGRHHRRQCA